MKGVRRKVAASTKLPGNWQDFLKDDTNKAELFSFLSNTVTVITDGNGIRSNQDFLMPQCFQEEADTRMVFHLKNMIEKGLKTVCFKTVDSDVVVILVGLFHLVMDKITDVWVEYGVGKNLCRFSIKTMHSQLGESKAKALLFFHAFTGSDTTSGFRNKGKKLLGTPGDHLMK